MVIGPAPLLAVLVGIFHTSLYVVGRGAAGGQLPLLLIAACLGAWAGDALGARLGIDLLRIGDFRLLGASVLAWAGIGSSRSSRRSAPSAGGCVEPRKREQAGRTPRDPPRRRTSAEAGRFVRGLTIGLIVGAVIAGSTLWRRFGH